MSEQFRLFGPQEATWTASLWERIDPETRNEVLSILAEMARGSLRAGAKRPSKERRDER